MTASPEIRLKRFIHIGQEIPTYMPGNRHKNEWKKDDITAVNDFLVEGKHKEFTSIILKAFTDGYSVHPEAQIFALAVAARQDKSEAMREAAYITARTVCKSTDHFFLFIHFCSQLAPGKGIGKGLKRVATEWYLNKDPIELLNIITQCASCHGWSHRDVIKLCHISAKDKGDAMKAIFCYITRGHSEMKKDYADKHDARLVVAYLHALHDFRNEGDKEVAMRLAEVNKFTFDHSTNEMKAHIKWIWPYFIPKLPLPVVLGSVKRLGHMRLINGNLPLAEVVHTALLNQESISKSNLSPAEVFITMKKYEKITVLDPEVKKLPPKHKYPEKQLPLEVNPKIVEGLNFLLGQSFKLLVPTGLRYIVIVDVRQEMSVGPCYNNNGVTPLQAASIITLGLIKTERSVLVGTYGNKGSVHTLRMGKNLGWQEVHEKFVGVASCPVNMSQPINWARNKAKDFNIFIMITNNQVKQENQMSPGKALQQYRKKMERPSAKLIVCGLSCVAPFGIADVEDPGMLEIAGFDGKVPRVIEAFSRGAF